MREAPVFPLVIGEVEVRAARRLTASFVRVELGGEIVSDIGVDGGFLDARVKLIFPSPGAALPRLAPTVDWYTDWLALAEGERGAMRTYTVRDVVGEGDDRRLVVDIVVHDVDDDHDSGPGNDWAQSASVGDRVVFIGPRAGCEYGGVEFKPPAGTTDVLLLADETAAPAVYAILRDVGATDPGARGVAYVEVPVDDDVLDDLAGPDGVEVVWLPRNGRPRGEVLRENALVALECRASAPVQPREVELKEVPEDGDLLVWETPEYSSAGDDLDDAPEAAPFAGLYAWIAGESKVVTGLRRVMVKDFGVDRHQVSFMGYWRDGVAMKG